MNSPIYLTQREVYEITGKKRYKAQLRALGQMGIQCRARPDGRPLVSRLAFERAMGGTERKDNGTEPDWEALDATTASQS